MLKRMSQRNKGIVLLPIANEGTAGVFEGNLFLLRLMAFFGFDL